LKLGDMHGGYTDVGELLKLRWASFNLIWRGGPLVYFILFIVHVA